MKYGSHESQPSSTSSRHNASASLRLALACAVCAVCAVADGQSNPPAAGQVNSTAVQPPIAGGHDYIHLLSESVNPATGQLTVRIQFPVPKGRGITAPVVAAYNSGEVSTLTDLGSLTWATNTGNPGGPANGWGTPTSVPLIGTGTEWNFTSPQPPQGWSGPTNCNFGTGLSFTDLDGTAHTLSAAVEAAVTQYNGSPSCTTNTVINTANSDGQTFAYVPSSALQNVANGNGFPVYAVDIYGNTYSFGTSGMGAGAGGVVTMEDRNGNILNPGWWNKDGNGIWQPNGTDTAGRSIALQVPAVNGPYNVFGLQYTVTTTTINMSYSPSSAITVADGANCGALGAFPSNSATITVISSIELPNGQKYQFHYDSTYGVLNEIDFPDGGNVKYQWNLSPNYASVASFPAIKISDGSQMSNACTYEYTVPVVTSRWVSFDGSTTAQMQTFSYSTTWDPNNPDWTAKNTTVWTTDGKAGSKGFETTYAYSPTENDIESPISNAAYTVLPMEQTVQHYDWGNPAPSTPLDTVTEAWINQFEKACEVHTLNNGRTYGHFYTYQYGFVSDDKAYDMGQVSNLASYCQPNSYSAPSVTPARETVTTFTQFTSPFLAQFTSPVPPNMTFAKPYTVTEYGLSGGSQVELAQTINYYDQGTLTGISGLTAHDETHFSSSTALNRGNLTEVVRKCLNNGCSGDSITQYAYDEAGQLTSMKDPCGYSNNCANNPGSTHTTMYSYLDSYTAGGTPPGQTDAYLTKITDPKGYTQTFTYSWTPGELQSSTDQNSQTTNYSYDSYYRLNETQAPPDPNNGNQRPTTTISYNDSTPNPSVTTSELLSSSVSKTSVAVMDGVGHTVQTLLTSDPVSTVYVNTLYDGEGRAIQKSNPTRCSSSPGSMPSGCSESTWGITAFTYDALGRTVVTQQPDGSVLQSCYNGVASTMPSGITAKCNSQLGSVGTGTWVDSTDELGNQWQRTSDAFGDLLEVMEPNGTTQAPSMETDYAYDGLGELLSVVQKGDGSGNRNRYFAYDSQQHLVATMNPENFASINPSAPANVTCSGASNPYYSGSWTTCYSYDLNGNLLTKKDNRQITATYYYDNLNRITKKTFNDGVTPTAEFGYDGNDENGNPISGEQYAVGHLTKSSNEVNAASEYFYDPLGHTVKKSSYLPGDSSWDVNVNAGYDLAGDVTSLTNGSTQQPITLTYGYNSAAQLQTVTSSWTPDGNHPLTLFQANSTNSSAPAYGPSGGLMNASMGIPNGSQTAAYTQVRSYDNRLRITSENYHGSAVEVSAPSGTVSISGTEQSKLVGQAAGTGWISVSGSEQSTTIYVQCGPYGQTCSRPRRFLRRLPA